MVTIPSAPLTINSCRVTQNVFYWLDIANGWEDSVSSLIIYSLTNFLQSSLSLPTEKPTQDEWLIWTIPRPDWFFLMLATLPPNGKLYRAHIGMKPIANAHPVIGPNACVSSLHFMHSSTWLLHNQQLQKHQHTLFV